MTATETPIGQALEQKKQTASELVGGYRDDFALVLPSHVKPEQFVRLCQGVIRRNPQLAKVAMANPRSLIAALLDCAYYGLEPGDTYHLVPFGSEIVGIKDYTGIVELIYRAGSVSSVTAEVVYRNDTFVWKPGKMERPEHDADWFGDRGDVVGAYSYAVMKDGTTSRVVVMSRAEIDKVKAVSKTSSSKSSPWQQWYPSMCLKTVTRQLEKWVPTSPEYRAEFLARATAAADIADAKDLELPKAGLDGDDVLDVDSYEPGEEPFTDDNDSDPGPGGWDE